LNKGFVCRDPRGEAENQGDIMVKFLNAVLIAAALAALLAIFTTPGAEVVAGALPQQDEAALNACAQRPWPYLDCVGTRYGNQHVRLVTTDELPR
jgi:hypothetical protein